MGLLRMLLCVVTHNMHDSCRLFQSYHADFITHFMGIPQDSSADGVQKVETQGVSITERLVSLGPVYLGQVIFTLVLLIFLLASGDMFYEKIVHTLPNLRDKRRAKQIAQAIERQLSRYLLTITVINAGLGTAVGLAMWALGMPSPLIFGIIAFLFNFVPYLGAIIGVAIAATVALVSFTWLGMPLVVGGAYLALTTLEGQFVTPYFIGRSLRLNSVVVFLAISFWAWLWSAVGMIVAVPLLVAVKTFCDHISAMEPLGNFLAERHAERESYSEEQASD
ncbi:AI-2E family transporter [Halomonas piscis]|uniref:AI-2E family transporter n=1 Tax=Halomonas piscis TaxID=3031727 RepID=A0ABY9YZS8_9GAMM|nr:AI-2E family transporter [Halomonas piscis]WNK20379.1 AI-2E family transporter [Halomonas piscis]